MNLYHKITPTTPWTSQTDDTWSIWRWNLPLSQVPSVTCSLPLPFFFSHKGQEEIRPQAFQQMEITFPDCPRWRYNYHNSPGCQWKCSTGPWIPCQVPLWHWFPMAAHHYRNANLEQERKEIWPLLTYVQSVNGGRNGQPTWWQKYKVCHWLGSG